MDLLKIRLGLRDRRPVPLAALLTTAAIALGGSACEADTGPGGVPAGQVLERHTDFGAYALYVPEAHAPPLDVLVLVHGTPSNPEEVPSLARRFLERWVELADERGLILVAPAFDQPNFGSISGLYGGYRGLNGRHIGADEFVHVILDSVAAVNPGQDPRFYLYGHSAGGQFTNRYLVRHPDRIRAALISAAGRFAFPDPDAPWHFGMDSIERSIEGPEPGEERLLQVTPEPDGWVRAATLPVTVLVGDLDTDPQPSRPGQLGVTRIEIAQHWVDAMNDLAREHGETGRVRFVIVPGVGHNSAALTPASQAALFPE